jgi:iron complex transport system substrate-binding protein
LRIVALQPSVSVTLAALGRAENLVAVTRWCMEQMAQTPDIAARNLPVLPDSWSAGEKDIATLREIAPDLIIASVPYQEKSLRALLESGLPVLALAPRSLKEIYADTRLLAALVDARDEAEILIARMHGALEEVAARVRTEGLQGVRVSCEEWNNPMIHSQPWVNELVVAACGIAIGKPGAHTTAQAVAAENPDAIVAAWCGAGDRVPLRRLVTQRGWHDLRAVQQRRVYCVPDEFLNTPAIPSLLEGLACIAHCVQPEIFSAPERLRRLDEATGAAIPRSKGSFAAG